MLISLRKVTLSMGNKLFFKQMVLGHLDIHMQKNEVESLPHTIHKNETQNRSKTQT